MDASRWRIGLFLLLALPLWVFNCSKEKECPTCPKHPATLCLSVHKVELGDTATGATFDIRNTGEETLNWTVGTSGAAWLDVSPISGSNDATITLTADRSLLQKLGQYEARIYVSAGSLKDSVEVCILCGGKWLQYDDGTVDACVSAAPEYLWLVNYFRMPQGMNRCFVDSVKINFCEAGPVRLRAFNAKLDSDLPLYWPDEMMAGEPGQLQGEVGWNTFKVNWYVTRSSFFVGYLQPELATPDLNYDIVTSYDIISYLYDLGLESWVLYLNRVFYIRIYITPVPEYAPETSSEQGPLDLTPQEQKILGSEDKKGVMWPDKP